MKELTKLIYDDMQPALGVTEPGAIAFAVAKAKSYTSGELVDVDVGMNSGMYKNAFTCGIPNSDEVGNIFSAALGYVAGNPDKGLEALADVTKNDNALAKELVDADKIHVHLSGITSKIFIQARVKTTNDEAIVTIRDAHTNITKIEVNGKTIYETDDEQADKSEEDIFGQSISDVVYKDVKIHEYTLQELYDYVDTVDIQEIDFIEKAFTMNMELFEEGLNSNKTSFINYLKKMNGDVIFSDDEHRTASLLCGGAIEARVMGLDKPAMSITGSGAHGIIATLPLYASYKVNGYPKEKLLRATALSYLVCMYIKEYSGKLSAFCGCAIAAGTGMACGLVYLKDGTVDMMDKTINNMASSITGMICDGGNQGCTMKGIVAVDAAYKSVEFAMHDVYIQKAHGINDRTPELTMKNMGLIASPGMKGTEKTIVEIFQSKLEREEES